VPACAHATNIFGTWANRQLIAAVIQAERASALASEPLTSGDPAEVAGYRCAPGWGRAAWDGSTWRPRRADGR
jgi:hypothetical protein